MSEGTHDSIKDFFQGRHVFYTGASGLLGTAYLSCLLLQTPVARVYAPVRGGESRLWDTWKKNLPLDMVKRLQLSGKLVVWDGDINHPDCGLTSDQVAVIHKNVSVFIHGASTINLMRPLADVAPHIIQPSLKLAKMALACVNLTRFVYVSTAYASAFLREASDGTIVGCDVVAKEEINHIRGGPPTSAARELSDLEANGSTLDYESVHYSSAYGYTKHLAERLLLALFNEDGRGESLLIFRPSCIGPAESSPYPFFQIPGSCPVTSLMASVIAAPPTELRLSCYLPDPSAATLDEIPVDMAVNRLMAHIAFESSGCVHAVSDISSRHYTNELLSTAAQLRSSWWGRPQFIWGKDDWKSDRLWFTARVFAGIGCSFGFDETKTKMIWERMSVSERECGPYGYVRISQRLKV